MVSFIAHTDGKVIVPDEPVDLSRGQRFVVTLEPVRDDDQGQDTEPNWLRTAREVARQMPHNLPEDLAEQHDHYLYGTPKK